MHAMTNQNAAFPFTVSATLIPASTLFLLVPNPESLHLHPWIPSVSPSDHSKTLRRPFQAIRPSTF